MSYIATPSRTRHILEKYDLRLTKRWGQNFLIDPRMAEKIARASCFEGEGIIEIGPGIGSLTEFLVNRAGYVVAVEIDPRLVTVLKEEFKGVNNLKVLNGDVLKQDLDSLAKDCFPSGLAAVKYSAVGNLPYYVTTPIMFHLFEKTTVLRSATLMMQREVAERIMAAPGTRDYGALSVTTRYYADARLLTRVSSKNFFPQPDIESVVVHFNVHEKPPVDTADVGLFFEVVRAAFNQRRKTLLNCLNNSVAGLDKDAARDILLRAGIDPGIRGEALDLEGFAAAANSAAEYLEEAGVETSRAGEGELK